jgi:methanogenic corrinoid protein MtbC1
MIFTTLEGETHTLAVLAAAMLAPSAGVSPIFLGPNLPVSEILLAVRRSKARGVALQLTDPEVDAEPQVKKLLEGLPDGVELWLGGKVGFPAGEALVLEHFSELEANYRRIVVTA